MLKKNIPHVVAVLLFLILSIIYTKPALEGKVVEQHDVKEWKAMSHQSFVFKEKHGHFPRWVNNMFCGMPGYQIAMDSKDPPYVNVYYFHLALTFGLPKPVYYLFFCCLGFYFLSIVIGINPWLSIAGGIIYGYCSYNPILITAGHDTKLLSMAYMPAVLASLLLIYNKRYWIGGAMLIIATTCLLCQSHQQIAYYLLLIAICMTIPFLIKWIQAKEYKHLAVSFGLSMLAAVLAVCFVSNSYFPVYEYSKETMRGGGNGLTLGKKDAKNTTKNGLDKDYAFNWSYGKAETLTLLVPNAFGGGSSTSLGEDSKVLEYIQGNSNIPQQAAQQLFQYASAYWGDQPSTSGPVYFGSFVCFLALAGFIFSSNKHKWWLLGVTVFSIVLAWGKNLEVVNYFLFDYLPLYKKFRAPSMALVMAQVSIPVMAFLFLQEFISASVPKRQTLIKQVGWVAASIVGFLALFYGFASFSNANTLEVKKSLAASVGENSDLLSGYMNAWIADRKALFFKDMLRTFAFIGIAFGVLYAYQKQWIKLNVLFGVLLVISIFDMLPVGKRYFNEDNFVESEQYESSYALTNADIQLQKDSSFYRVLNLTYPAGNGTWGADIGNAFNSAIGSYHHNTIGGYHPAKLSIFEDLKVHQIFKNIQAWASGSQQKDSFPVLNMLNMKYVIVPNQSNPKETVAIPNPYALGNCWLIKDIKFVQNADDEMLSLNHFNPATTAITNVQYKSLIGNDHFSVDTNAYIHFVQNVNDYIKYESNASSPQFAVFSEIFYSQGWNAYVDGKQVPFCKVNYALRGMPLPAGKHIVEFKFEPALVDLGEKLSKYAGILSVLLVFFFTFLEWKSRKAIV